MSLVEKNVRERGEYGGGNQDCEKKVLRESTEFSIEWKSCCVDKDI